MKKVHQLHVLAAAALSLATGLAHAASFEYVFDKNITAFNQGGLPMGGEPLATPYARMTVLDVNAGVQVEVQLDTSYSGWLDNLAFNHVAGLDNLRRMDWLPTPIPADQPYFYSSRDAVNGSGTGYSTYPSWAPSSTNFVMYTGNPFGDRFWFVIENLPEGVSAASLVPQYLYVRNTYGWGLPDDGVAYVGASPVPEPGSVALASLGLALMGAVVRRRRA